MYQGGMYTGTLEPRTNRESWTQLIALIDPDTDQPFDITGFTIDFEIRKAQPHEQAGSGYVPFYDWGAVESDGPILTASTANGAATIVGTGMIQVYFSQAQMRTLHAHTYNCNCIITDPTSVNTKQILHATLPILGGGVT